MNDRTKRTLPTSAPLLRAAALALGVAGLCTAALALPPPIPRDLPRLVVSFADLNLDDGHDVAILYRRLEEAAHKVCPLSDQEFLQAAAQAEDCRQRALLTAARKIQNPRLTAMIRGHQPGR